MELYYKRLKQNFTSFWQISIKLLFYVLRKILIIPELILTFTLLLNKKGYANGWMFRLTCLSLERHFPDPCWSMSNWAYKQIKLLRLLEWLWWRIILIIFLFFFNSHYLLDMAPLRYHKNLNCHVNATDTFNLSTRKFLVFVLLHFANNALIIVKLRLQWTMFIYTNNHNFIIFSKNTILRFLIEY